MESQVYEIIGKVQSDIDKLTNKDCLVLNVKRGTKIKNQLDFARKKIKDSGIEEMVWTGSGAAISKVVSSSEIIKREFPGFHQVTNISYKEHCDVPSSNSNSKKKLEAKLTILLTKKPLESFSSTSPKEAGTGKPENPTTKETGRQFQKRKRKRNMQEENGNNNQKRPKVGSK